MSSDDLFSDSQVDISSPPSTPSSPAADIPSPEVVGIVDESIAVEFIAPPKKKRKVELDQSLEVLKEFSSEMIRIENERTEMLKDNENRRIELLAERNHITRTNAMRKMPLLKNEMSC